MALLQRATAKAGPRRAGLPFMVLLIALGVFVPRAGQGKVLLTTAQALELAFPGCATQRQTVYLTPQQQQAIARLSGVPFERAIVYLYRAICDTGTTAGVVVFDTHRVRTLEETLAIAIGADHTVRRVDVVSFREPEEYLLPTRWFEQFNGRPLSGELAIGRSIRNMTGASLSSRAAERAIRRALAIVTVLDGQR